MALKLVDAGGVLQTITKLRLQDGGTLRNILRLKVMDADGVTLRTVATFAAPLSASISFTAEAEVVEATPGGIPLVWEYAYYATAAPAGGLGPYSYTWEIISGSNWAITNPSAASTSIVGRSSNATAGTALVTIVDSSGQTATATLPLSA